MDINNINYVVEYINNELEKNRSFKDIESELGFNDRVLYKRLIRKGYKRSDEGNKLFILVDKQKAGINENKPKPTKTKATNQLTDEEVKKLKELLNRFDDILYMLDNESDSEMSVIQTNDIKQRLFRVDKNILDKWDKFCNEHQHIKKQNLISSALSEYIEKYSKE